MPGIADIFQETFNANQPPPPGQVPPVVDLFGDRQAPPALPVRPPEPTPAPAPAAPQEPQGLSQDVINQAAQLQAALNSQGGILAGLGQSFGIEVPQQRFFGRPQNQGMLEALLGPALSQIQGQIDPSLLGIPEIAALFNPQSFAYQRPGSGLGALFGGVPKFGTGFQRQQPDPGSAATALNAFLNGV